MSEVRGRAMPSHSSVAGPFGLTARMADLQALAKRLTVTLNESAGRLSLLSGGRSAVLDGALRAT